MIDLIQPLRDPARFDPVAFRLGPLVIRWYSLAYSVGFLLAWWYMQQMRRHYNKPPLSSETLDDAVLWLMIGVILGGRIGYVLFYNIPFFIDNPLAVLKLWQGGMSFHGGALGVIIAIFALARSEKIELWGFADLVCAAVPIGLFLGRIANFINGELFGRTTDYPWGLLFPRAGDLPRHPSQLYEAFSEGLLLFLILYFALKSPHLRERRGVIAGLFLAFYGLFRFAVEFTREPDAHLGFILEGLTMGQILSLPMIVIGGLIILVRYRTNI